MNTYVFHLPDGNHFFADTENKEVVFGKGEFVIFEDDDALYRIASIQHQFSREKYRYVLTNIILERQDD